MISVRRFYIRLRHWEYWPFHVVYVPIYFYWFWLCFKAKSLFFFSASNPTIRYAGFLMESKKEVYDLIPKHIYPTTVYCSLHQPFHEVEKLLNKQNLDFPLIAKPDIGLRGMGVRLLHSIQELQQYQHGSKVDYLVQTYINYQQEAGIFYYRMPGEKRGHITGIVAKELLQVQGDGEHTIQEIMEREDRFILQLPVLRTSYGVRLQQVLQKGEKVLLVPFGNHSRGAKFIDWTHLANDELLETIDTICRQVPGFYFGRLDVKYDNWKDLCQGKKFSIIELNGAGSEPAHIYDPKHSLLFGWKEIVRHWTILYEISRRNKKRKNLRYMTLKEGLKMFKDNKRHVKKIA